jgi:hypothetical protein
MGKGGLKGPKWAWGRANALLRPPATGNCEGTDMVNVPSPDGGHDSNFPAHVRNYLGFMKLLKWTLVVTVIVTAAVLYTISN